MWQSRVEIKHYSVAYFNHTAAFEALERRTSVKGGAHTHYVNTYHVYTARMSPALNRSSALERFECSSAIKIRNGKMFDFYPGQPRMVMELQFSSWRINSRGSQTWLTFTDSNYGVITCWSWILHNKSFFSLCYDWTRL